MALHPDMRPMAMSYESNFQQPASVYPPPSPVTPSSPQAPVQSPFPNHFHTFHNSAFPLSIMDRRPSTLSMPSHEQQSHSGDELGKEKQRCPISDCGKVFKDLKSHLLTHQNERPEKCPITTCEYHTKGFARKYDAQRHTLTHYKWDSFLVTFAIFLVVEKICWPRQQGNHDLPILCWCRQRIREVV